MKKISLAFAITLFIFCTNSFSQSYVFFEGFESTAIGAIPPLWSETHLGGGLGWETHNGPYDWCFYRVKPHSNYMMVDDEFHCCNQPAKLTTSTFSTIGLSNPVLRFDFFFNLAHECTSCPSETAWLELSTDGGSSFSTLDTFYCTYGEWHRRFIKLTSIAPSANCKLRICYSEPASYVPNPYDNKLNGCAIDNIGVYDAVANDVGMFSIIPQPGEYQSFVKLGDTVYFWETATNFGYDSVYSYTLSRQVDSGPIASYTYPSSLWGVIAPFSTQSVGSAFYTRYPATTPGTHTVKMWITYPGDTNPLNDTIITNFTAIPPSDWPVKKHFIEEYTGTWCGWCPRGIVYMDSLWFADSNNVSIAAIHTAPADSMAFDNICTRRYDTISKTTNLMGYPSLSIDRRKMGYVESVFMSLNNFEPGFGFADLNVSHSISGNILTASAVVTPKVNLSGDYRLELLIIEQDVVGHSQANYYSGSTTNIMVGAGYNFNTMPSVIPAMNFSFVTRWTLPENLIIEPNGMAGSLPATLAAGTTYNYTFPPITIPSNWTKDKLSCIALLIDNTETSPNYCYVLNSSNNTHAPTHPISLGTPKATVLSTDIELYPNPASVDATLSFNLHTTANVSVIIYDALGRNVKTIQAGQQNEGVQFVSFSTADLAPGVYNVVLITGNSRVSRLLSVVK